MQKDQGLKIGYLQSYGRTKVRRLRDSDQQLMREVLPGLMFDKFPVFDFNPKELLLEIGFGDGGHLLYQALNKKEAGFIGCEPFINGTAKLLRGIEANKLHNIKIYPGDFRELELPASSVSRVFILFPDPWPKKRHNKRRLISHETLDMLAKIMKPGASLRIATDHEDYAKWIALALLGHEKFCWLAQSKADWQEPPPDHIATKYQKKNLAKSNRPIFFEAICNKKAG